MGAGIHGGFGKTKGTVAEKAPVSRLSEVRYSKKKMEGYLLNINHEDGKSKAKFMHDVLGYEQSDSKLFHKNVVSSIINKIPSKTELTEYGLRHVYHTTIVGKNGNSIKANVIAVIQKDNGRITYKIVTVYPDERSK